MSKTNTQFEAIIKICLDIFTKKMEDYGTAWRIMRPSSITDQIFIKAQRIRTIETLGIAKVDEGIKPEFIGIINYSVMGLIQLELGSTTINEHQNKEEILSAYHDYIYKAMELMKNKNHDYGEAWRSMRISSLTDLILMKIHRTKQIEDNNGNTIISEGIDANYFDMINYAIFCLIKLELED